MQFSFKKLIVREDDSSSLSTLLNNTWFIQTNLHYWPFLSWYALVWLRTGIVLIAFWLLVWSRWSNSALALMAWYRSALRVLSLTSLLFGGETMAVPKTGGNLCSYAIELEVTRGSVQRSRPCLSAQCWWKWKRTVHRCSCCKGKPLISFSAAMTA